MGKTAGKFWRDLFAKFPSLDPESVEHYDEGVDSSDVVQWIGENAEDIRKTIADKRAVGDIPFTPGPWHARLSDNGIWFYVHCEGTRIIASMDAVDEEDKANAALVELAPDFYDACEKLINRYEAALQVMREVAGELHDRPGLQEKLDEITANAYGSEELEDAKSLIKQVIGKSDGKG